MHHFELSLSTCVHTVHQSESPIQLGLVAYVYVIELALALGLLLRCYPPGFHTRYFPEWEVFDLRPTAGHRSHTLGSSQGSFQHTGLPDFDGVGVIAKLM